MTDFIIKNQIEIISSIVMMIPIMYLTMLKYREEPIEEVSDRITQCKEMIVELMESHSDADIIKLDTVIENCDEILIEMTKLIALYI
jgi:hypothetical protein